MGEFAYWYNCFIWDSSDLVAQFTIVVVSQVMVQSFSMVGIEVRGHNLSSGLFS